MLPEQQSTLAARNRDKCIEKKRERSYSYSFYASRNILLVHKLKERKNLP
jgi:hypothetical protein